MKRPTCWIIIAIALVCTGQAASATTTFVVKYVSAENVYLNGGQADGLAVGDHLMIYSRGDCPTEVEIVFVADHSASCKTLSSACEIVAGERAILVVTGKTDTAQTVTDSVVPTPAVDTAIAKTSAVPKSYVRPSPPKVTGSVSLLYYLWNDRGVSNLDFAQTTARLNLKVRRLFGKEITFSLRTRGRYDQRQRAYVSTVSRDAWENRIWECSLGYEDPSAAINVFAGRLLPRRVAGAGYLDGVLMEGRVSEETRVGLFAGNEPSWAYADRRLSLYKAGGYVTFSKGQPGKTSIEQTIAGVGEYHGFNVSREFAALQGRFNAGTRWGFYHTAEFDINRSWRKERTGKTIALSSLYLGSYYRLSSTLRLNLSYDTRTNYWTYEARSTVDSLFDHHLRQGIRTQLDVTLPAHVQGSVAFGQRKRQGDPAPTNSYSFHLNRIGLWHPAAGATIQFDSFNGPFEHGLNYSLRLSDNIARSTSISLAYGAYTYRVDLGNLHRSNRWYEVGSQTDLLKKVFLGISVQFNSGDDISGVRLQSELGWRF
jgi:hypothetical protein